MDIGFKKIIFGSGLGSKILLFFVVLATVPLLVVGVTSLYLIDGSHRHDVSELEMQIINQKIKEIEKFFSDTLGIIEISVGTPGYKNLPLFEQEFLLKKILETNPAFREVSFALVAPGDELKAGSMEKYGYGEETAKFIRGTEKKELFDVSGLKKFKIAVAGGSFIGPVNYSLSGPGITLAAPVRNRGGEVVNVLSAEVSLREVINIIEEAKIGNTGWLVFLDADGRIIASGSDNAVTGSDFSGFSRVKSVMSGNDSDGFSAQDRYASMLNGAPVVGSGKRMENTGWMIFAEWPLSEADSVINGVKTRIVVSTFFCILAVLILAPLFASRLIKPIRELESAALEIETGNFDKRVEIKTKDELEDLGGAFNKMAQGLKRLQELKNEFVFLAAHELRTPVTAIKGYVEMFLEDEKDAANKYNSYFHPIKESSKRLQKLVNDLLEVARSESGKLQVVLKPINITEIVEECVSEIKPMADEKSVHVSYLKTVSHIDIMADPDKLKDIISNLLSNAVKYNKNDGSIDIYHEVSGGKLITHIRDTGMGISEEDIKKLFTKFFRASGAEKVLGTGLGLFLVKELVERMDGEIWVESKTGVGSTFSFGLRLSAIGS